MSVNGDDRPKAVVGAMATAVEDSGREQLMPARPQGQVSAYVSLNAPPAAGEDGPATTSTAYVCPAATGATSDMLPPGSAPWQLVVRAAVTWGLAPTTMGRVTQPKPVSVLQPASVSQDS